MKNVFRSLIHVFEIREHELNFEEELLFKIVSLLSVATTLNFSSEETIATQRYFLFTVSDKKHW